MKTPKKTTKTSHQIGKCPACGRRVVLGRCKFKGGGVDKMDHCRRCCWAPVVNGWKAQALGA